MGKSSDLGSRHFLVINNVLRLSQRSDGLAFTYVGVSSSLLNDGPPGSRTPSPLPYTSASGTLGLCVFQAHGPLFNGALRVFFVLDTTVCVPYGNPSRRDPHSHELLGPTCPARCRAAPGTEKLRPGLQRAWLGPAWPTQPSCVGSPKSAPPLCREEPGRTLRGLTAMPGAQQTPWLILWEQLVDRLSRKF